MTPWFRLIDVVYRPAITTLIIASIILLAVIVVHQTISRSSAGRHAIILLALVSIGLCPVMVILAHLINAAALVPLPNSLMFTSLVDSSLSAVPFRQSSQSFPPGHPPIADVLLVLWAAGSLISLARLIRGLHTISAARNTARPIPAVRISALRDRLTEILGRNPPEILTSEQIGVPAALGYLRPVVILPSSFLTRFRDDQLFQVLVHECAHALRRDALVGLYQRLLASVLWFHPLIYVANRLLDRAREDICDNYVLQSVASAEYSRTLLAVAQSLSPLPNGWFAPTLVRSARHLENRVAGLLHPERCIMTKLTWKKFVAIATGFFGGALVCCCFAAQPTIQPAVQQDTPREISHTVHFDLGTTYFQNGDRITIDEVRGTADTLTAGNVYQVKGTYKLVSRDRAQLAVNVTTGGAHSGESNPNMRTKEMTVGKGDGRFSLVFYMWQDGSPHVSFYPYPSGDSFAGVYFGTGSSVYKGPRAKIVDRVNDTH